MKMPADPTSGESPLPDLQMAILLIVNSRGREQTRQRYFWWYVSDVSSYKGFNLFLTVTFSWPKYLPKTSPYNIISLGVRILTKESLGEYKYAAQNYIA